MKKLLTPILLSIALSPTAQGNGLENAKCTTNTKELEFFVIDKNNHCRDLRKSCEYKSEFYSLGAETKNGKLRCGIPTSSDYNTLAHWLK